MSGSEDHAALVAGSSMQAREDRLAEGADILAEKRTPVS